MKIYFLAFIIFLSGCQEKEALVTKKQYYIFGTIVEVLIWHHFDKNINLALIEIEDSLNQMHNHWHAWKPGRLNDINQALRSGSSIELNPEELEFIKTTKVLSNQSQGYFNPAMGELINKWGFHTESYPIMEPPPEPSEIEDYLANLPNMDDLVFNGQSISCNNPRIWLDYGGIAKGYAIDKAIKILEKHSVKNAIVNAGGDLRSIGTKGEEKWKVAIRRPNSEDVMGIIEVDGDESIFTSGNYERYKEFDGKRYAHIINPFTGTGVLDIASATVIAENGTKADAAATALIVAGTKNWSQVVKTMNLDLALMISEDGSCLATKNMVNRLSDTQLKCKLIYSDPQQ
jgi:thiamine biosynthesis lipoprotein